MPCAHFYGWISWVVGWWLGFQIGENFKYYSHQPCYWLDHQSSGTFGCHIPGESPLENSQKWGFSHLVLQILRDLLRWKSPEVGICGISAMIPRQNQMCPNCHNQKVPHLQIQALSLTCKFKTWIYRIKPQVNDHTTLHLSINDGIGSCSFKW